MNRRVVALVVATLVLAAACTNNAGDGDNDDGGDAAGPDTPVSEVEWGACEIDVPAGLDLDCGTLEVPADRDDPDAGTVTLAFGVVRTDHDEPADDPVLYLSGGPGQDSLELVPAAFGVLYEPLAANRDLIILDQRGTGYSEPSLACEEHASWVRENLDSDLPAEQLAAQSVEALAECRERLVVEEDVDLSAFNSAASAADLDDLRRALEVDEWNLYGISYGTRLALTAMRDHPEGIRSVVLDSAYPVDADLYEEMPENAARAMSAFFDACASDAACEERFGDLGSRFTDLVERLDADPVPVTLPDPATGRRVEGRLDGATIAGLLFQSLYATELVPLLPEILDAATRDEVGTVGVLLGAFSQQIELVSMGQQLAVQCQEEVAFGDREAVEAAADEQPVLRSFFESAPTIGAGVFDICDEWDAGEPGPDEDDPVESAIPTLVLAGELDPVTPPRWGEAVAADLANSFSFTFPSTGHGVVPAHDCAAAMTRDFLDDPGAEPDAGCIDDIEPLPFSPEDVEVELVPVDAEYVGFAGVRPEGWTAAGPGVYQESLLTSFLQQVVPGTTAEQVLNQVARQIGADEPPAPVGQRQTEFLTWDLYELDDLGLRIDVALAEHEGSLAILQVASTPQRRDVYVRQVFEPALDAFDPSP
jgi:pimeloyl-ACP methyl ester carboxylesterase